MSGRVDKKLLVGSGISLLLLFFLFRKIEFAQLAAAFRAMDWRYLVLAVGVTFIGYWGRAVRWRFLLMPLKATRLRTLFPATIIGYMANNLLPARLGEFVRAYVLAGQEDLDTSAVFATLVIDRLWDGFSVLVILVATFFTVRLPEGMHSVQKGLITGGYVTLALYLAVIIFLVVLKRNTVRTIHLVGLLLKPFPAGVSEKVIPLLGSFITGIRLPASTRELAALAGSSFFIWLLAAVSVDLLLKAFGIILPFTASLFILVFLVFAVMVPATPGFVGTYHAACMYGLMAFQVSRELALSVALVMHAINFFPVIVAGFYFLWRNKLSLRTLSNARLDEAS